jgi:hypothetical protein
MRLTLRHAFAVELRHLLNEVVIVEQDRTVRADGERVLVAFDGDPGIRRRRWGLCVGHRPPFRCWVNNVEARRGLNVSGLAEWGWRRRRRARRAGQFISERPVVVELRHRQQVAVDDAGDPHQQSVEEHAHLGFPSSVSLRAMLFQVMSSRNLSCATAYFTLSRVPLTGMATSARRAA